MAARDALQGTLPLLVLTVLDRRGPLHGYAISTQIETLSDALRVEEGSLYPALHRMEEAGWVRAKWMKSEAGRRMRQYEITPAGRKELSTEETRWRSITAAVSHVLKHA